MVQSLPRRNGGLHLDIGARLQETEPVLNDCEVQTGIHDLHMQEA
jgi:hypothetical protein